MEGLLRNLRFGIRMLIRTPLLSVTAILTFGLGVGAPTFIYSVSYVFGVLPVRDAVVYATVIMILGITCIAAALLPALKALRVDPVDALREG